MSRCFDLVGSRRWLTTMGVVGLTLALVTPALAQRAGGRVRGRVTDQAGAPLEGVTVTADKPDNATGALTATTNDGGNWSILGFTNDTWTFTFEKAGYSTEIVDSVIKTLARNANMLVILGEVQPSTVAETASAAGFIEGNRLYDAGDYAGAIAEWEIFYGENPQIFQIQVNIGNAHREMGDLEKARASYQAVLEYDPGETRALYNLGELAVRDEDFEGALPYFETVVELSPDDPAVFFNIAEIYFDQRQTERAAAYYQRALEADPTFLRAQAQLGYAYVNMGDMAQAVAAFERYLEIAPADDSEAPVVRDIVSALKESL